MARTMDVFVGGNLGNIAGAATDGVLLGQLTATDPDKVLHCANAERGHCVTDDGGLMVDETTPWSEGTADDVEVLAATPAVGDACYWGHPTKFKTISMDITTAAADLVATLVWEYWNGTAYVATLSETDNTTGLTAATGVRTVVFTPPTDWAKNTVKGINAYWIRVRVSAFTSITTAPQVGSGHVVMDDVAWTDVTTDFTDAGTDDVKALPDVPTVEDGLYIIHSEKYCKLKVVVGQARTGTATLTVKYWDGTAYTAIPAADIDDDSVGWSATAGTHYIHFVPPSDWVVTTAANGPNGEVGFVVVMELTALTDVTAQPLITQGWVLPIKTGTDGKPMPIGGTITTISMNATTNSATNGDSTFIVVNSTKGTSDSFVWSKGDPTDSATVSLPGAANDKITLVQITEDGTTEFANASIGFKIP